MCFFSPLTGGLSTTAIVKIQLTDVNDNRPVFYPREYNVSMRESSTTSASVVTVVASDPDSARFGMVTYRIVAGNDAGIFRIDRVTGEVFVTRPNLLSGRNQPYHRLNISAIDGGGLRTAQDAEIFISIIDASQRPPIFEKSRYNFAIKEDAKKNTIVGSVSATSSNSGEFDRHLNELPIFISKMRSISNSSFVLFFCIFFSRGSPKSFFVYFSQISFLQ